MSRSVSVCLLAAVAFVAMACVSLLAPAPALAATGTLIMETPLHQEPDPAAPVIALLSEGTVVTIDGPPVDGFYPVTTGDLTGWMRGETLELQKDIAGDGSEGEATPDEGGQTVPIEQEASDQPLPAEDQALQTDETTEPPATDSAMTEEVSAEPAPSDPAADASSVDPAAEPVDATATDAVPLDTAGAPTDAVDPAAAPAPSGAAPLEEATAFPAEETPAPTPDPNVTPIPVVEPGPNGPASAAVDLAIRVGPGRDFDLITTVPAGSPVEQTGHLIDGYVSVQSGDVTGWAAFDQLGDPSAVAAASKSEPLASEPAPTAATETLATTTATPEAKDKTPEPTATPAPTPEPPVGPASVVGNVPIYAAPDSDSGVIFTVPDGSTLEQTGEMENGYISVQYKEVYGWAAKEQLTDPIQFVDESVPEETSEPVDTKTPRPGSGVAYNTVDLSLRAGPSANEEPITVVPAGSRLVLTGVMEGDFQRVTFGDDVGWVSNQYLTTPKDPAPNGEARGKQENYSEREIVRIIYQAADRFDQDRNDMLRVARCESNLDPYAVNPSGSYGLFQFIRATWKTTPYGDKDIFDPSANANAAAWMWSQGRKSEWVCQ